MKTWANKIASIDDDDEDYTRNNDDGELNPNYNLFNQRPRATSIKQGVKKCTSVFSMFPFEFSSCIDLTYAIYTDKHFSVAMKYI